MIPAFVPAAAALLVGLAVAGLVPHLPGRGWLVATGLAAALVAALVPRSPWRLARGAAVGLVALTVVLVQRVLMRGGWSAEVEALSRLASGALLGAAAALLVWRFTPRPQRAPRWLPALLAAAVVLLAAVLARTPPAEGRFSWRAVASDLGEAPGGPAAWVLLERLQAAGFADAAWARAALLADHGAEAALLRAACDVGRRTVGLDGGWGALSARGERLCRALRRWPEEAARALQELGGDPAAVRLRGDVLMDAGRLAEAVAAYRAAGDGHALARAAQALVARGRLEQAAELGRAADREAAARVAIWLQELGVPTTQSADALTDAWNRLLRFDSYEGPSRRGLRTRGKGKMFLLGDSARSLLNLTIATPNSVDFTVFLPLPPRREVPRRIELSLRNRRAFRVGLATAEGAHVSWGCSGWIVADNEVYTELPAGQCRGWQRIVLEPPAAFSGAVSQFDISGVYSLEYIRLNGEVSP